MRAGRRANVAGVPKLAPRGKNFELALRGKLQSESYLWKLVQTSIADKDALFDGLGIEDLIDRPRVVSKDVQERQQHFCGETMRSVLEMIKPKKKKAPRRLREDHAEGPTMTATVPSASSPKELSEAYMTHVQAECSELQDQLATKQRVLENLKRRTQTLEEVVRMAELGVVRRPTVLSQKSDLQCKKCKVMNEELELQDRRLDTLKEQGTVGITELLNNHRKAAQAQQLLAYGQQLRISELEDEIKLVQDKNLSRAKDLKQVYRRMEEYLQKSVTCGKKKDSLLVDLLRDNLESTAVFWDNDEISSELTRRVKALHQFSTLVQDTIRDLLKVERSEHCFEACPGKLDQLASAHRQYLEIFEEANAQRGAFHHTRMSQVEMEMKVLGIGQDTDPSSRTPRAPVQRASTMSIGGRPSRGSLVPPGHAGAVKKQSKRASLQDGRDDPRFSALGALNEARESGPLETTDAMAAAMAVREYLTGRNAAMAGPPDEAIKRVKHILKEYSKTSRQLHRMLKSDRVQQIMEKWYSAPLDGDWTLTLSPRERDRERRRSAPDLWDEDNETPNLRRNLHSKTSPGAPTPGLKVSSKSLQRTHSKKSARGRAGMRSGHLSDSDDEIQEHLDNLEDQRLAVLSPATLFNNPGRLTVSSKDLKTPRARLNDLQDDIDLHGPGRFPRMKDSLAVTSTRFDEHAGAATPQTRRRAPENEELHLGRSEGGRKAAAEGPGARLAAETPSAGPRTPSTDPATPSAGLILPSVGPGSPSAGLVSPSAGPVTPSAGPVSPSLDLVSPSVGPVTQPAGPVSPSAGPVTPSASPSLPSAGFVSPSAGLVSPSAGLVSPSAGPVTPSAGPVRPSLRSIDSIEPSAGPASPSESASSASPSRRRARFGSEDKPVGEESRRPGSNPTSSSAGKMFAPKRAATEQNLFKDKVDQGKYVAGAKPVAKRKKTLGVAILTYDREDDEDEPAKTAYELKKLADQAGDIREPMFRERERGGALGGRSPGRAPLPQRSRTAPVPDREEKSPEEDAPPRPSTSSHRATVANLHDAEERVRQIDEEDT